MKYLTQTLFNSESKKKFSNLKEKHKSLGGSELITVWFLKEARKGSQTASRVCKVKIKEQKLKPATHTIDLF